MRSTQSTPLRASDRVYFPRCVHNGWLTKISLFGFQLKALTYSTQLAQNNVAASQQSAEGAQKELAEKTALVDAAKERCETLRKELETAKQDLSATRQAAIKVGTYRI